MSTEDHDRFDLFFPKPKEPARKGYEPKQVPISGMRKTLPEFCHIETEHECGCGLGQCSRGLIF